MALQNVTPTESIFAEMALVWALTRVCETSVAGALVGNILELTAKEVALKMFQVQVGFIAMRAFVLALGVLGGRGRGFSSRRRRPTRVGG
jgi:hypothetical protein